MRKMFDVWAPTTEGGRRIKVGVAFTSDQTTNVIVRLDAFPVDGELQIDLSRPTSVLPEKEGREVVPR